MPAPATKKSARPVSAATQDLLDDMRADGAAPVDKLEQARDMVRDLRDREMDIAALEERLKESKRVVKEIKEKTIPDFFDEVGVPKLGIDADGNMPAFEIEIKDRYHANIPDETEAEAHAYLKKVGAEDLIKTTFTIAFGLRESKAAERFARSLDKAGIPYSSRHGVPWNSLTSWFTEEYQKSKKPFTIKVMAMLGATVGRVVKVVKQKETK